jgi:hypothetical protein
MPFRFAYVGLLALFPVIVVAFWPRYFGSFAAQPFAVHLHGLTAAAWTALVTLQSWSITHRQFAMHRLVGRALFVLVPLFGAGALTMMQAMIGLALARTDPFHAAFGLTLALDDVIAVTAFLALIYVALAYRRQVWVHGGAMLGTVLLVLPPILARLLPVVPGFPQDSVLGLDPFVIAVETAQAISIVGALLLAWRAPKAGKPFLFVAAATVVQSVAMESVGHSAAWAGLCQKVIGVPVLLVAAIGLGLGAVVVGAGWRAGRRA